MSFIRKVHLSLLNASSVILVRFQFRHELYLFLFVFNMIVVFSYILNLSTDTFCIHLKDNSCMDLLWFLYIFLLLVMLFTFHFINNHCWVQVSAFPHISYHLQIQNKLPMFIFKCNVSERSTCQL